MTNSQDYQRVEQAIRFLAARADEHPSLDAVAAHVDLSPYHFQRLFQRWAGVSPKRFLQALGTETAKARLRASATVLDAAFAAGLSGPGRLHDLFVAVEAVTPGEFKTHGRGLTIRYGVHPTPFGPALAGLSDRGLCHLAFMPEGEESQGVADLLQAWQGATLEPDAAGVAAVVEGIFAPADGAPRPLSLFLKGTNFQIQVWRALLAIPEGAVTSYGELARRVDRPGAARAVGTAVGKNPVAYLIPCHRVLRETGDLGGYRWGTPRKRAMLGREWSHADGEVP